MRTTSMRINCCHLLVMGLLGWGSVSAVAEVRATIQDGVVVDIQVHQGSVVGRLLSEKPKSLKMDSGLARKISESETFFAVGRRAVSQDGKTWLILVTQTPSRADRSAAACGSGTEDVAHLLQIDLAHSQLVERSSVLLQSCLSGLSINDDSGESLERVLEKVKDPSSFQLKWLEHPQYGSGTKTLAIKDCAEIVY